MDDVNKKKLKVLVGMSGGVDSSTTAAILKSQGYEVSGVFLRFWKEEESKENKSLEDAKKVAEILNIPFYIVDAREDFKKTIVDNFLNEYESGRTPNPCIICNREMKFKILLEKADEIGADYVATGHYAIVKKEDDFYKLFAAKDKNKDQSYFLYRLTQKELSRLIFPLGEYEKKEVREMAKNFNLSVFAKEESQDICFLKSSVAEFLGKNLKSEEGDMINEKGEKIGTHKGLPFYTIGQRKGIDIGGDGPYFVVSKDLKNNVLVVTNKNKEKQFEKEIEINSVTWTGDIPDFPAHLLARTRYRNPLIYATINAKKDDGGLRIVFGEPQKAVSPGQSVVFYSKEEEVVGGGIIR